jgi:hypothetical protein
MKPFVATILSVSLLACTARAGDSFFSTDGRTVTFAPLMKTGHLLRLDVASGKLTELPLPPELKNETVSGVTSGAEGEALFIAGPAVWVLKDGGPAKRVVSLKPVKSAQNLFVDTKAGSPLLDWLFVSGSEKADALGDVFYARKPGGKGFSEVFCRRVNTADCGCFAADGRFFFAGNGDVWEGGFMREDDPNLRIATLVGARIAPVALLNTDDANAGSMAVGGLSAAGKWLYTGLRGRHMGCILRVPIPAKPLYAEGVADPPEPKAHLDAMRHSLEKTEVIVPDTGGLNAFCACEVEGTPRVFYRGESDEEGLGLWLWNGAGKPKRVANEPRE